MELDHLLTHLDALPPRGRTAFAALCCERLLPTYQAFQVVERAGSTSPLIEALDAIWAYIGGATLSSAAVAQLQEACKRVAPDTEEYTSLYAELALITVSAVCLTLQTILDQQSATAAEVAERALAAVDAYLNRVAIPQLTVHAVDPAFDAWVASAPLLASERQFQQENIAAARAITTLQDHNIARLRAIERTRGIQPFIRGLVKNETSER
ncbi:MAG: DUF416 family protein [Roseiflexaceae bacterium]|nr:DUF416 family protein [Roseiflexaceae bacterium]